MLLHEMIELVGLHQIFKQRIERRGNVFHQLAPTGGLEGDLERITHGYVVSTGTYAPLPWNIAFYANNRRRGNGQIRRFLHDATHYPHKWADTQSPFSVWMLESPEMLHLPL